MLKIKIAGYNPITGQAYTDDEDEKKRAAQKKAEEEAKKAAESQQANGKEVHTSTRVLNPPGGRSTKLW